MLHQYFQSNNNVLLRPIEKEDIESLRNWRNNPQNTRYLRTLSYITPQMQEEWFKKYLQNDDELCFAIYETHELKRLVGSLSLYGFSDNICYFGKLLIGDEEAHGRKIGLNATIAAIKIAFNQLNLKEVKLHVFADNIAALKVYKQSGFVVKDKHIHFNKIEYTMCIKQEGNIYAKYE